MLYEKFIGSDITLGNITYKILSCDKDNFYLINKDSKRIDMTIYKRDLLESILNVQEIPIVAINSIPDTSKLSEKELKRFNIAVSIVKDVESAYGPTYINLLAKNKNGYIKLLSVKYDVSVKTIWKYIRRYLQSGFDYTALLDGRMMNKAPINYDKSKRIGRKRIDNNTSIVIFDDKTQQMADTIIKEFKRSKQMSIRGAYQLFINRFFSEYNVDTNRLEWLPENERPTFRQFDYYLRKKLSKQDLDEIRTTKLEVLNNKRVLTGSSRANALRPGWIVECDAVEVDISLVSDINREQSIGRPIMYVMVDVLTSCILAVSVSFENNSIIGLTNLFLNLCEDKEELCKRYGLVIDPKTWPSNVVPHEIRCDRGSDFVSNKFKEICRLLKINLNYEAPGVGSYKGIVEQTFHQFHATMKPKLESYGAITKRHDSKHHEHAMLTISAFMKLVLNYVIYHNIHIIKDYPLSKDMLNDPNFKAEPYRLWSYYTSLKGTTYQINETNRNNYLWSLLLPATAKISRRGVEYKDLIYINDDSGLLESMYNCGTKIKKFEIKYDPRNTSNIYYYNNGKINKLWLNESILNNRDFKNMTWNEYKLYQNRKKELQRNSESYHLDLNNQLRMNFDYIIEESKNTVLPSTSNLLDNRRNEKFLYNKANKIVFNEDFQENELMVVEDDDSYYIDTADLNESDTLDTRVDSQKENIEDALQALLKMMKGI